MTNRHNTMLRLFILLAICAIFKSASGRQIEASETERNSPFKHVLVKKRIGDKICDTCRVSFAHSAGDFSYMMTGAGNTPPRFYSILRGIKASSKRASSNSSIHLISQRRIGITFLPNSLISNGKRIQLYRNFGGDDYAGLEFSAEHNGRFIKQWTPLLALGEDKEFAILGEKEISGRFVLQPWKPSFFAGNFDLAIGDSLNITVRNSTTKRIVHIISIKRPEDKANNFLYYQLPLRGSQFNANLQDILNVNSGVPAVYRGDSSRVFEKEFGNIGMLRFGELNQQEEIQYLFKEGSFKWQTIKNLGPGGAFIVLANDMQAGKDHEVYLRYKSQPETVHKIIIRVKTESFEIPWRKIASISTLLLAVSGIGFYLWSKRHKQKLAALKRKNEDIETRLSLLSGQLNPHFLFNSLNTIQGTINSSNPERANAYIGNVAGFMRDVMDNGKKEFVSLAEELKIEEDYLKLEQERMDFSYNITITPGLEPSLIDFPPLLLQPVLENSIRHAFDAAFPDPMISLAISGDNGTLSVEVSDNGSSGWDTARAREGHGLSLTRKRIVVYNEKLDSMSIHMQIKFQTGRGTVTTFTFQNWLT